MSYNGPQPLCWGPLSLLVHARDLVIAGTTLCQSMLPHSRSFLTQSSATVMDISRVATVCYDSLLAVVYPQPCHVCGRNVESRTFGVACESCWRQTRLFTPKDTVCWKCGLLSPGIVRPEKREQVRCRRCDDDAFTVARACGAYNGALRVSIIALKHEPHVCSRLVKLIALTQQQTPLNQATRIVPVPLHPERQRTRGFNQAAVIAEALSRNTSIVLDQVSLVRTTHADQHRAGMDARDRRKTVESAFKVLYPALIEGDRVLLVDDVFTTGATVSSCAQVLREAGAAEVFVLTIARPVSF